MHLEGGARFHEKLLKAGGCADTSPYSKKKRRGTPLTGEGRESPSQLSQTLKGKNYEKSRSFSASPFDHRVVDPGNRESSQKGGCEEERARSYCGWGKKSIHGDQLAEGSLVGSQDGSQFIPAGLASIMIFLKER